MSICIYALRHSPPIPNLKKFKKYKKHSTTSCHLCSLISYSLFNPLHPRSVPIPPNAPHQEHWRASVPHHRHLPISISSDDLSDSWHIGPRPLSSLYLHHDVTLLVFLLLLLASFTAFLLLDGPHFVEKLHFTL